MDRIRNKDIGKTVNVSSFGAKIVETRLRWFGHGQRRDSEYMEERILKQVGGEGTYIGDFRDVTSKNLIRVGVRGRTQKGGLRQMTGCGNPRGRLKVLVPTDKMRPSHTAAPLNMTYFLPSSHSNPYLSSV